MLRSRSLGLCLVLISAAHAAPARADRDYDLLHPPEEERTWYGWQTMATDGAAFAMWFVLNPIVRDPATTTMRTVNIAGLGIYVLGAPIVHAVHGNVAAAAGSFGLRVLPMIPVVWAHAACTPTFGNPVCAEGFYLLSAIAFIVPLVLDPVLFAYEKKRDRRTAYVEPWLDATSAGLILHRGF